MTLLSPLRSLLSIQLLFSLLLCSSITTAATTDSHSAPAVAGLAAAHVSTPTDGTQPSAQPSVPLLPRPFEAVYVAKYSGMSVKATRTLLPLEDGTMELRFVAKSWLATIREVSQFNWSPTGQLIPQYYLYQRRGLGHDRTAELNFDWDTQRVKNDVQNRPWSMDLPEGTLDKLSYQLQLSADTLNQKNKVSYKVADGGRLKVYDFQVEGQEILDTPLGKIKTTRIKRIRDDNERVTVLWLATDWNHLLVKIWQQEEDGQHYEINLASAKLDGETVTGF
jgi:hypothetical protein